MNKALFTVGILSIRLRMSYFNPNDLGLKASQIITFEQTCPLLDRALANDISHSVNNKKDAFLFSKWSKRTNHLVLAFLIQKREHGHWYDRINLCTSYETGVYK